MSDIFSKPIHMQVFMTGNCPKCRAHNEVMVHDYGKIPYRELEDKMDQMSHKVVELACKKCGSMYLPAFMSYREANGKEIIRGQISHGNEVPTEEAEAMVRGHDARKEIFSQHEEEFWAAFISFALEEWRDSVNELLRTEIEHAYKEIGIVANLATDQQARRDVLNRFKTDQEKAEFWRLVNYDFVYDEVLEIGPMGWSMDLLAKHSGPRRTRFAIIHFPLAEALEGIRTRWMGELFRKDKGDNSFLLRRIGQLADDVARANKRTTEYYHKNEALKHEAAGLQTKLAAAYEASRKEEKATIYRDPDDIRKIREMKSFISELMAELRELRPEEKIQPPVTLIEEVQQSDERPVDISVLTGKTVGIIGGLKRTVDREYPCTILISDGTGPDFYSTLIQSDYIVVLTKFVSHEAMWEAKAHALQEDKPSYYLQETNIGRILSRIAFSMSN